MASRIIVAKRLAASLLAGPWNETAIQSRMQKILGRRARTTQRRLRADILAAITTAYPPSPATLVRVIMASPVFGKAAAPLLKKHIASPAILTPPLFAPAPAFAGLAVPQIATPGELAVWLGVSTGRLDWLADIRRQHGRANVASLQNYCYTFIAKRSGLPRLIESPKSQLKEIQRRILREILSAAPVHDRAHGFVQGRSCLTSAQLHAGEYVVVTVDLKHFFTSVGISRIHGLFRSLGYPWAVARLLTGLCASATPLSILTQPEAGCDWEARKLFNAPHLPQGAPTSPALANLCAWTLDQRLAALGSYFGANYTRYADDIAFSGDRAFARQIRPVLAGIEKIVESEGFVLNKRKTRIMRSSGRQRVTGIVLNEYVNVDRDTYDRLKATLHNCMANDTSEQNRDGHADFRSHLNGRVGWVEQVNPHRGARLREMFDRILW
jgi:hypothetical protein